MLDISRVTHNLSLSIQALIAGCLACQPKPPDKQKKSSHGLHGLTNRGLSVNGKLPFRVFLYVHQHSIMNLVNDVVTPKLPVNSRFNVVIVPSRSFQKRFTIR